MYNRLLQVAGFLLLFLLFSLKVSGQSIFQFPKLKPSYFESFDHLKSYPSMCFSDVFQDREGRLWLKTCSSARQSGLVLFQFDGYEFSPVKQDLDSLEVKTDFISLYQGHQLIAFDPAPSMNRLLFYDLSSKKLEYQDVDIEGSISIITVANHDQIFIFSEEAPFFYVYLWEDNQLQLVRQFAFDHQAIKHNHKKKNSQVYHFSQEEVWTVSADLDNLLRLDISTGAVEEYGQDQFSSEYEYSLLRAGNFLNWSIKKTSTATYLISKQNIWRLDKENGKFVLCLDLPDNWFGRDVFEDQQGNVIYLLETKDLSYHAVLEDKSGKKYDYSSFLKELSSSVINKLISENFKEQVIICSSKGIAFAKASASEAIQNILPNYSIRKMAELPDQRILITTQAKDRFIYNLKSGKLTLFDNTKCYFHYSTLIPDQEGNIWSSGFDGLIKYEPETGACEIIENIPKKLGLFTFMNEHQVIMINERKTINIYDFKSGITTRLREGLNDFILQGFPHDIHYSKDGWCWIATSNGLYKIDIDAGVYEVLGFEAPFSAPRFLCIHEDQKGRLWLGTPLAGVNIYNPETRELEKIDSEKGLANNTVVSIQADSSGDYWLGTYNGVSIVSPEGELIANIFEEDGLSHRENNRYAYLKTKSGKLLIGTIDGLNIIDPEALKERVFKPKDITVYLTDLSYSNSDQEFGEALINYNLNPLRTIVLPASNRFINFKVACSNYFRPEVNQYAYKFEGIDEDWIYVGNQHNLSFNNLPTGKYRILVIAGDDNGNWSEEPLVLNIRAKTIFYQQIWFYLLCLGLIIGGAFLWINRLRNEVKKATKEIQEDKEIIEQQAIREKARAEKMQEQARQIEIQAQRLSHSLDELQKKNEEILRTQNQLIQQEKLASLGQLTAGIAHEIKNPLNFINNFAEGSVELLQDLIETTERNKSHLPTEELEEMKLLIEDVLQNSVDIKNNGSRLDLIVHSMMDHARGSGNEIQPVNLNKLIDDNINLAHHGYRALEPGFSVHLEKEFDETIPMIKAYPQELGRVILNLLNNAFYAISKKQKITDEAYRPHVHIKTVLEKAAEENEKTFISVHIKDNGNGIPKHIKKKIFEPFFTTKPSGQGNTGLGLSIAYDIITKQHRGQLLLRSELDQFTEFIIKIPIK